MGPKPLLPLWVRVDLGIMVMKGYSIFSKSPRLESHYKMQFCVICKTLVGWGSLTPSAEMQLAYSTTLVNWAAG